MKNTNNITNILISILIVLIGILIFLTIRDSGVIDVKINTAVENMKKTQPVKGIDYNDGITPVKGVDYTDGKSIKGDKGDKGDTGAKGENGIDGIDGKKGSDGVNGSTPELRCNVDKNRWEFKYTGTEQWRVLNESAVRCTMKAKDIIEILLNKDGYN